MRRTDSVYLHVTVRLQLINYFKRTNAMFTRNSNTSTKTMMACTLILIPFTKEAASLYAKPGKHKLHLSAQSSLTSENVFGSAHVKIGV